MKVCKNEGLTFSQKEKKRCCCDKCIKNDLPGDTTNLINTFKKQEMLIEKPNLLAVKKEPPNLFFYILECIFDYLWELFARLSNALFIVFYGGVGGDPAPIRSLLGHLWFIVEFAVFFEPNFEFVGHQLI